MPAPPWADLALRRSLIAGGRSGLTPRRRSDSAMTSVAGLAMTASDRAAVDPGKVVFTLLPILIVLACLGPRSSSSAGRSGTSSGQPGHRPVRRRRHDHPADHDPDRLPEHLPGDEGDCLHEPAHRPGPGRPVGHAAVRGPRPEGAHEGRLHADRRRRGRVHLGAGRDLWRGGHDRPGTPVRARASTARTSTSGCSTSSRWAAWASSAC